jgi:hypothetical protein
MTNDEMDWLRLGLRNTAGRVPMVAGAAARLDGLLAEMDEVIDGKGDGVVSVERGRVEGVEDVVVLPFGHLSVTDKAEDDAIRQVHDGVLARLQ